MEGDIVTVCRLNGEIENADGKDGNACDGESAQFQMIGNNKPKQRVSQPEEDQ